MKAANRFMKSKTAILSSFSSSSMLRQLVPMDLIKSFSPDDWKKVIASSYNRHTIRSQDDAKVGFLKYVGRWPTFGSAFFEVKVSRSLAR